MWMVLFQWKVNWRKSIFSFSQVFNSGLITIKHRLNYERHPVVTFEVLAIDQGVPALTGTATVMVNVEDVNDVVPMFETDYYNLDVPCDEAIGTTVVTVAASDDDSSKYKYSTSIGLDKVDEWVSGYEATTGKWDQSTNYTSQLPSWFTVVSVKHQSKSDCVTSQICVDKWNCYNAGCWVARHLEALRSIYLLHDQSLTNVFCAYDCESAWESVMSS